MSIVAVLPRDGSLLDLGEASAIPELKCTRT
jgi:hypothetical protein